MTDMVPDLSLTDASERQRAVPFFRNVKSREIHCSRDKRIRKVSSRGRGGSKGRGGRARNNIPRDGTPRSRNGLKKGKLAEAVTWNEFLTAPPKLESLAIDRAYPHHLPASSYRSSAPACVLVALILTMAATTRYERLYLGDINIDLDAFRTFINDHCSHTTHICLDEIHLFSDAYSTYDAGNDTFPVAPEETELAKTLLEGIYGQKLRVAVLRISGAGSNIEQVFNDEDDFEEVKTITVGTRIIRIIEG